jgi:flagellar hook-length control protein FliK
VAKKAGAAKPKKGAKARAKKAATGEEAKQEQEERLAEAAPVSEGKLRSFLRLIKKDDKPKDQVQEAASIPRAFFKRTDAGGVLVIKLKVRSW